MLRSYAGIRHYRPEDRGRVFHLLSFLPKLYPGSFDWLDRRLIEVERERAFCNLAIVHSNIAGILIETPKGVRTSKISTFFVGNPACRQGVGTLYRARQISGKFWWGDENESNKDAGSHRTQ